MPTRTISQTIDLTNKPINKYITEITNGGIKIHDSDDTLSYIQITNGEVNIYRQGILIATYGINTIIGNQNDFHIQIDGTELGFYQAENKVAYINNNQLYITQSVVLQQMDLGTPVSKGGLGQWSWKVHANGQTPSRNNLNLKWIG